MISTDRIELFVKLGDHIRSLSTEEIETLSRRAQQENGWFTLENVQKALSGISFMLTSDKLMKWTSAYTLQSTTPKKVGIVMAGNIPMVGFHDLMCVIVSGHIAMVKASSQDKVLISFIINTLTQLAPTLTHHIILSERLNDADAVIATGSDNSARYFEYYFGTKPHIIRKNRTSVAILTGNESDHQLKALGKDVTDYFGLGCRNVSKLFIPTEMDLVPVMKAWEAFLHLIHFHKYKNNYDYNKSIYLINKVPHLDNGAIMLTESTNLVSPVSVCYYERYSDENDLAKMLTAIEEKTQCMVSISPNISKAIAPGKAQLPEVWDYADGVDTLQFLLDLQ